MAKKYKQRADGRYYTKVSTGKYTDEGKAIYKYLYAKSSRELEKKVSELKYELEHGTYANDKGITFGEYAWKWFEVSKATKTLNTKKMYSQVLRLHIDILEHKKLKDITRFDIQAQINKTLEYTKTCENIRMTVYQVLDNAVDDGLIAKNPCKKITLPKRVTKEKRALTQIEKEALKNAELNNMERAYVTLLYYCGIRPQELYALTVDDIDLDNKVLRINKAIAFDKEIPYLKDTKTFKGNRVIPLPISSIQPLKNYLCSILNGVVFRGENGEYMKRGQYYRLFESIVRKMIIASGGTKEEHDPAFDSLVHYTFRHNYCTELYYSGISLLEAVKLMGHEDYTMIMKVYAHLDELKENTRSKLDKILI